MRKLPLIHHDLQFNCTMVHAGIPPNWTINDALGYAAEVESILQSEHYSSFFENMYGNLPSIWSNDLKGWDRLRVITNYLTRLRYCTQDGEMELTHKTDIQPEGFAPWFSFPPNKNTLDGAILFGHWAAIDGVTQKSGIIALDTGCVWGRKLTAYRLEDQQIFSVDAQEPNIN